MTREVCVCIFSGWPLFCWIVAAADGCAAQEELITETSPAAGVCRASGRLFKDSSRPGLRFTSCSTCPGSLVLMRRALSLTGGAVCRLQLLSSSFTVCVCVRRRCLSLTLWNTEFPHSPASLCASACRCVRDRAEGRASTVLRTHHI